MNSSNPSRVVSALLSGLSAVLTLGFATTLPAQAPPAGDLTVTVNELENGHVRFAVSGTAYMQDESWGMSYTNYAPGTPGNPPMSGTYGGFPLPEGLKLTVPANQEMSETEGPSEIGLLPVGTVDHSLSYLYFSGGWYLANFSTGPLYVGDPITGSGVVTSSDVPFTHFVPGTFLVTPSSVYTDIESTVAEGKSENGAGQYPYFITYKVIPYSAGLHVEKPKRFENTLVDRSSRTQRLTITNLGSLPITGLKVSIPEADKKNFEVTQPAATTLAAGGTTTFRATFTPSEEGQRRAVVTVTGGNQTKKIILKGKGIDDTINSPRFPRGPRD